MPCSPKSFLNRNPFFAVSAAGLGGLQDVVHIRNAVRAGAERGAFSASLIVTVRACLIGVLIASASVADPVLFVQDILRTLASCATISCGVTL